ncbi:MAG: carboxypeptidase regulatory-like domain-containing protein [Bacteroidales bacterium]|nr:carboxypeptidase regulatory-like domain-containing protein [Bacteroidales bacterium]
MNLKQDSKLSMCLTVKNNLTTNAAIVTPLPNYNAFYSSLDSAIIKIQNFAEEQMFNKSGLKTNKEQLKQTVVRLAADASRKIQAYAKFANNQLLLSETKFPESVLKYASDNELRDYAQGIYDRAQSNLAALGAYGITEESQGVFLNAINIFVVAIPMPRIGKLDTKQSTAQLADAFKEAEDALDNIDALVEIVKLTQPTFYNSYKSARKLVSTSRGSLAVKGLVTDAATGEPIKGVSIRFELEGSEQLSKTGKVAEVIEKKTADKGGYVVKTLATGTYLVSFKKTGYKDLAITVNVIAGELCVVNVSMTRN